MLEDDIVIDVVHHCLEGGWWICEAEIHDCQFVEAVLSFESSFVFISLANVDVVVPPLNVELYVDMGIAQIPNEVWYKWEQILVMYGEGVDFLIVLYWL